MSPELDSEAWAAFEIPQLEIEGWKSASLSPFEAALAHGDGFTPLIAVHYRRQLRRTAAAWQRAGLGTKEGLFWHRAGFTAKEAVKWRDAGVSLDAARALQHGYNKRSVATDADTAGSPLAANNPKRTGT